MNVSRVRSIFLCIVFGAAILFGGGTHAYAGQDLGERAEMTEITRQADVDAAAARQQAAAAGQTQAQQEAAANAARTQSIQQQATAGIAPSSSDNCSGVAGSIGCMITNLINSTINLLLGAIVNFLGSILMFLVDILLSFAAYNGFGTSIAVVKGWMIVRDIANMFFIVILVVSAISTIIDYDDSFNYKKVLPKLMLMALLINFSRTLIMMLVDFSQVLMLTFVNGFKAAAAGNFVNALKLNKILDMSTAQHQDGAAATTNGISFGDVFLAYLLGIMMLCIAIGVIVIQIAYLIVRIIGLWIALIFSPLAFLVTAVPARLKKSLSSFSEDYWSKLGALLSGGPIMAFFLWLTLAIVQSAASDMPGNSGDLAGPSGATSFITSVGTAPEIATFIVAISMMLLGLEQATKVASSLGSAALTNFAGKTAGYAKGAAKFAAKSPYLLGKAGVRKLDRSKDITGKVSSLGLKGLGKITQATGIEAPAGVRNALASGVVMRRNERNKMAKETSEATAGMSAAEKRTFANTISSKDNLILGATKQDKLARANILADASSDDSRAAETKKRTGEITKAMKGARAKQEEEAFAERQKESKAALKAYEDQLTGEGYTGELRSVQVRQREKELEAADREGAKQGLMSDDDIKQIASSRAMEEVAQTAGVAMQQAKSMYEQLGNNEEIGKLDAVIEKTPSLEQDPKKFEALMTKIQNDPSKIKNLSAEAKSNGKVLMALLPPGAVKETNGNVTGFDEAQFQSFLESDEVKSDKLLTGNLLTMKSAIGGKTGGIAREDLNHSTVQRDKYGENAVFLNAAGGGGLGDAQSHANGIKVENDRQVAAKAGLSSAMSGGGRDAGAVSTSLATAIDQAVSSGVDVPSVLKNTNNSADQATAKHLAKRIADQMLPMGAAVSKKEFDEAFSPIMNIVKDISDPSVGTEARVTILSGFGNEGARSMKSQWTKADPNQRKAMMAVIEESVKLATQVSIKRAKGGTASANEMALESFVNDLKEEFPRNENEGKSPGAIVNALHNPKT